MEALRRRCALIIGRNAGLAAALAQDLQANDVRVAFDDPDTNVITHLGESPTSAVREFNPNRALVDPVDQIFRIMGPPASDAPQYKGGLERTLDWAEVYRAWNEAQFAARHPYHVTFVITQPLVGSAYPRFDQAVLRRVIAGMRELSLRTAAMLQGAQVMAAYVDIDVDEDWHGEPSPYDRAVAGILRQSASAHLTEKSFGPFRAFSILRQPDGTPLVTLDEG